MDTGILYSNMKRSEEHNRKIAASLTGRKLSAETKKKMSASHRKYLKIDLVEAVLYLSLDRELIISNQEKEEDGDDNTSEDSL